MNGEINLTVSTSQTMFQLVFDRNISVIRGDSGTGKSYLCDLLSKANIPDSGVTVSLDRELPIIVMPETTIDSPVALPWYKIIQNSKDTLFFIDENCDCLSGDPYNLSQIIRHTSNYYIIISRQKLADLPYSVHSIYELKADNSFEQSIIRNVRCYTNDVLGVKPISI